LRVLQPLASALWPEGQALEAYAILDGARSPRVHSMLQSPALPSCCLYSGKLSAPLQAAAPYVVHLRRGVPEVEELLERAWGASWGIFLRSEGNLESLRRHFRRFLRVRTEAGQTIVFRYYDPRVFRVYLPTCNVVELGVVFGPVAVFVLEGESPETVLCFTRNARGELAEEEPRVAIPAAPAEGEWPQLLA
jgi:hypothetical protein